MPFCLNAQNPGFTLIDDAFVRHFMPYLSESAIKVYLYGLMLASHSTISNTVGEMMVGLDMDDHDIWQAFNALKEMGLVRITSMDPLSVTYLSASEAIGPSRTIRKDKYTDFILQIQELFPSRSLDENELFSYLTFLEDTQMEPPALLAIAKYCVDRKGDKVRAPYVIKVAKTWREEGVVTFAEAEQHILHADAISEELRALFHALGKKSAPEIADRQLYTKWTGLGFTHEALLLLAKRVKKGGMDKLDSMVEEYHSMDIHSPAEVAAYIKEETKVYELAIEINRSLDIFVEYMPGVLATYTKPWLNLGYQFDSLLKLASYCKMEGKKDLAGMDAVVRSFYADGIIAPEDVVKRLDLYAKEKSAVARFLLATGSSKRVSTGDVDAYRTWRNWGFDEETILYAGSLAAGQPYPSSFVANKLAKWHKDGLHTLSAVQGTEDKGAQPRAKQPVLLADGEAFRRAEIKDRLRHDAEYSKLDNLVKTLEHQKILHRINRENIPVTLERDLSIARQARSARAQELGYSEEDIGE